MTTCAGKAFPFQYLVKLSRAYYADRENFEKDFRDTVLHEIAHIVTRHVNPQRVKPHGTEWKSVATRLGAKPDRCHALQLAEGFKRKTREGGTAPCGVCGKPMQLGYRQYQHHKAVMTIYQSDWYKTEQYRISNPSFVVPTSLYKHKTC